MPSNIPWLRIKGMKIDSKKRLQNKRPDNHETVLIFLSVWIILPRIVRFRRHFGDKGQVKGTYYIYVDQTVEQETKLKLILVTN